MLQSYLQYYNGTRTHLSLEKDAPIPRAAEAVGRILSRPVLGGLHHHYVRIEFATGTGGRPLRRCGKARLNESGGRVRRLNDMGREIV